MSDAPSLRESPTLEESLTLLSEGLDLCIRAQKIDAVMLEAITRARFPYPDGTKCATPAVWIQQQYDNDLGAWEGRTKSLLARHPRFAELLGNRKDGSSPKDGDAS